MSTEIFPFAVWPENILQARFPANDNSLRSEVLYKGALTIANAEPGAPSDGDVHIVGTPWGAFSTDDVVIYESGTWVGFLPFSGWLKYLEDDGKLYQYDAGWNEFAGGGGSGTVESVVAGTGVTVDNTDPANPIVSATGGVGATGPDVTDPIRSFWGKTKEIVHGVTSQIVGDPFIVNDGTNFIMYFFVTGASPTIKTQYKSAATLEGLAAASAVDLGGLTNYHKFVLLVDQDGSPVQIGGNYHAYAVKYLTTISDKEIYHFTCSTLTGTWALGSKVIAKGAGGSKDEYNTDTPYAVYDGSTIRLWYMGAPASSLATYGYAERILIATASDPDGPFTKDSTDVLLPNTSAAWDYGWMGGVQVRRRPNGKYIMLYNAGNTRPSGAGLEPNASAIGFAYSDSLDGPWTKDTANPYLSVDNTPTDGITTLNVWRGHMAFDQRERAWFLFFNTGGSGTERITYARQNFLDYWYDNGLSDGFNIQAMTTSVVSILNSRVNVTPGRYKISVAVNVMSDTAGGTTAKLDIDVKVRANGTALPGFGPGIFCGSYAYENRDAYVERYTTFGASGYFDTTIQVVGGTPIANSKVRRLRICVQRLD